MFWAMHKPFRAYIGVFFALMLAFTGQSMAVARGMPGAAGEITLCTGQGIVTISVDENGQPVEETHICPHFAMSFFAFAVQEPGLPLRPLGRMERLVPVGASLAYAGHDVSPSARGPPLSA